MLRGCSNSDAITFDAESLESALRLKLRGTFFTRSCYEEVYTIVKSSEPDDNNFLVLGSPGIGKSFCLLYFLIRLAAKTSAVVLFNNLHGRKYLFCSDSDGSFCLDDAYNYSELLRAFVLKGVEVYRLFDAGTKGGKLALIITVPRVKLIVASSLDLANYNQYLKDDPRKIFMEPWSFQELT